MPELAGRHERFCREYLIDCNAQRAFVRAGYLGVPSVGAYKIMQRPDVVERISELAAERNKELKLDANDIIIELLRILTSDPLNYVDDDGVVKKLSDIPLDARRAIARFEVDTVGTTGAVVRTKVTFWSKEKAAELLGKHLTLFKDVLAVDGLDDIANLIIEGRKRVPLSLPDNSGPSRVPGRGVEQVVEDAVIVTDELEEKSAEELV